MSAQFRDSAPSFIIKKLEVFINMTNSKEVITILDLFSPNNIQEKSDGNYKTTCPSCGLQGGRTEGMILFPENNQWFCHSSGKHGGVLELVALQNKIITCNDCLESGERRNVLEGELFKQTLDALDEMYGENVAEGIKDIAKIRKSIQLPNDGVLISVFADKLVEKLKTTYEIFYREDLDEVVEVDGNEFRIVKPARFITLVERYFRPWMTTYTKYRKIIKNRSINQTDANVVLLSSNFIDSIPRIERIFTLPIPIIYNGRLTFPRKGYDERFQSWLNFKSPTIKEMSLDEAKKVFYKIFNEFCFQDKQDYTNAISFLITPYLRGLFSDFNIRTPLFCWLANRERAGKDFGAGIRSLIYDGVAIEESPVSSGEYKTSGTNDETRKKIFSQIMQGKKLFHSANNKGKINNAILEYVLTARTISDRLLGKNEIKNIDNEIDYSLSGNIGLTMTPDLANRSRFIRLFLDIEDANNRKFENPNLHKWILDNRDLVVSSMFCLVKNWIDKKCPKGSIPFASYPEWAEICGGIMESADLGNPCVRDEKIQSVSLDEETEEMKTLFEIMFEKKPNEWIKKDNIKTIIQKENLFPYVDWEKMSDQVKFAKKFEKYVGRILSDVRLICKNLSMRTSRREYKFTKEKANFDKKSIFGEVFDEKVGKVGKVGKVCSMVNISYIYNNNKGDIESSKNPTHLTNLTKPKNDRELQFYETPETESIKPNHTKEDVLKFLKGNPNIDYKQLYDKFGIGSLKFRNQLKREGLI